MGGVQGSGSVGGRRIGSAASAAARRSATAAGEADARRSWGVRRKKAEGSRRCKAAVAAIAVKDTGRAETPGHSPNVRGQNIPQGTGLRWGRGT